MDQLLLEILVCPQDHQKLAYDGSNLICPNAHTYPVVDGTPVMLLNAVKQTLWVANASLEKAERTNGRAEPASDFYVDTLGVSEEARKSLRREVTRQADIDPVVQHIIAATCG